jgi:hypothetical protein
MKATPLLDERRVVHALLNAGILQKTEDGRIVFPFDAVHVEFTLKAA